MQRTTPLKERSKVSWITVYPVWTWAEFISFSTCNILRLTEGLFSFMFWKKYMLCWVEFCNRLVGRLDWRQLCWTEHLKKTQENSNGKNWSRLWVFVNHSMIVHSGNTTSYIEKHKKLHEWFDSQICILNYCSFSEDFLFVVQWDIPMDIRVLFIFLISRNQYKNNFELSLLWLCNHLSMILW